MQKNFIILEIKFFLLINIKSNFYKNVNVLFKNTSNDNADNFVFNAVKYIKKIKKSQYNDDHNFPKEYYVDVFMIYNEIKRYFSWKRRTCFYSHFLFQMLFFKVDASLHVVIHTRTKLLVPLG